MTRSSPVSTNESSHADRRCQTPYRACGPVTLERAAGAKPMTIHWRLRVPLPVRLFQEFSVLRGA
jgi:hypothetical protein